MTPDDDADGMIRITARYPDGTTMTFDVEPHEASRALPDVTAAILMMLKGHSQTRKTTNEMPE